MKPHQLVEEIQKRVQPLLGGEAVPAIEQLQQELQRFEGRLSFRVREACTVLLEGADAALRPRILMRQLVYESAALDIILGKNPFVSLLDMLAYVETCGEVIQRHWLPRVFGEKAQQLRVAFEDSSRDIWSVAERYLSADERQSVAWFIRAWTSRHPDAVVVESVRFGEFAQAQQDPEKTKFLDLLVHRFDSALKSANEAVLLGERAFYYGQRLPFLMRLHALVGVHDLTHEAGLALRNQTADLASDLLKRFSRAAAGLMVAGLTVFVAARLARGPKHPPTLRHVA